MTRNGREGNSYRFASVLRGTGNTLVPALAVVAAFLVHIPLSAALILGWGPFPQMGITGAGLAYIVGFGRHRPAHLAIAAGICLAIGAMAALFPRLWVGLFSADSAVLDSGAAYLRIVGPFYPFMGAGIAPYVASQSR